MEPDETIDTQEEKTEEVTTQMATMDFSDALNKMKEGHSLTRLGWNGPGQFVGIVSPPDNGVMTAPFLYIKTNYDARVPWLASQTDLLANDWVIASQAARSASEPEDGTETAKE